MIVAGLDVSPQVLIVFHESWSRGNCLIMRDCSALLVDGGGSAVIASEPLIFNPDEF